MAVAAVSAVCPGDSYTWQKADQNLGLNIIAAAFGASVSEFLSINPSIDPNNIPVGQVICLPSSPIYSISLPKLPRRPRVVPNL